MNNKKNEFIRIVIISFIIVASIMFVLGSSYTKAKVLVIKNNTSNTIMEFYLPNKRFSLGYIHSVMKTPAEEFFFVNEANEIVLEKTVYESFGVGLPFLSNPEDFKISDGKFILYTNKKYNDLNMIISPIPEHWLRIDDKKYELMELLKSPDCSIKIYIIEKNIINNLLNFPTRKKLMHLEK